jgi:hypothetical protein
MVSHRQRWWWLKEPIVDYSGGELVTAEATRLDALLENIFRLTFGN